MFSSKDAGKKNEDVSEKDASTDQEGDATNASNKRHSSKEDTVTERDSKTKAKAMIGKNNDDMADVTKEGSLVVKNKAAMELETMATSERMTKDDENEFMAAKRSVRPDNEQVDESFKRQKKISHNLYGKVESLAEQCKELGKKNYELREHLDAVEQENDALRKRQHSSQNISEPYSSSSVELYRSPYLAASHSLHQRNYLSSADVRQQFATFIVAAANAQTNNQEVSKSNDPQERKQD